LFRYKTAVSFIGETFGFGLFSGLASFGSEIAVGDKRCAAGWKNLDDLRIGKEFFQAIDRI
jgi:hypothetical protein